MANHNWYIGQDIVCIKTHSQGVVKEGNVYTIKSLSGALCKCSHVMIDVGIKQDYELGECPNCKTHNIPLNGIMWIYEALFAPLDTLTDISEIEEILNQPIEQLFQI